MSIITGLTTDAVALSDLSIYFEQTAYLSVRRELELTLSLQLILPVSSRQIADQGYAHLGAEVLAGLPLTTSSEFLLTPRGAFLADCCQVSLGMQIAVNGTAQSQDRVAVAGLVEIFYDDIFPALGWEPF